MIKNLKIDTYIVGISDSRFYVLTSHSSSFQQIFFMNWRTTFDNKYFHNKEGKWYEYNFGLNYAG